ncbi:MAG: hypothetical protein HY814_14735, partial [Candidatus Riflebacteria bacterium]|nr:hypothetical protein [Candidatus Riflebacteria bacterium]
MTRKNLSLALLAALGVFFGMSELALAGSADDLFGDDLIQTQQQRAYDDSEFARIMGQEFTDFHDGAKHRQPVLRRLVLPTGPYRFIEAPFDVFWDTVSFRSRESQSEGAALVTLMFKDAVRFVPNARATRFSMNRFIDTALSRCRGGSVVRPSKGVDDGFTGFDGPTGSQLEGYQDQSLPGKTGKDYKDSGSSLDFGIDLGIGQERYPWDERVGPGNGGYPGAYGKPGGLERPIILDQQDLIVLGDRYTVGGYQGLYDFSRRNSNLVKYFLTRAASECGYERLYTHAFSTQ